jgi:formylglycine-generating enzyme required for sulfatase activity
MGRQAAVALIGLALAGCAPTPFGEVLVRVESEPSVPGFLGHLRIDLYDQGGTWYQSRDVATPDASGWPISFSLFTDQPGDKTVRLRLRGYPEGGVRDYLGERFDDLPFVDPSSAHSLAELCAGAADLPPATSVVLRRAAQPVTELIAQGDCAPPTLAGSAAARITIAAAGTYHFAVVDALPDGARGELAGDTTLLLRRACDDPATQLACNDDAAAGNLLSSFDAQLQPGTYFLISGGKYASPADLTLRWDDATKFVGLPAPPVRYDVPPRPLALDGAATPLDEPEPSLAIDQLADVTVAYGERRTAALVLRGECLGTQADLFGGAACVDAAGVRAPVVPALLSDGIDRAAATAQGSWAGEQPAPCAVAPRPRSAPFNGTPIYDEELCVPGGAFTLGDPRVVGVTFDSTPRKVVALDPFLIDVYEYTVARYRAALAAGFVPPDETPWANEGPLDPKSIAIGGRTACTFSVGRTDREELPLTCVIWQTARALCQLEGGDLPSHAQWEYAATAAGRAPGEKSLYPWGDELPDCNRSVWGRGALSTDCATDGPQPVAAEPWASADRSAIGVSGMGGNAGEWALDSIRDYRDPCWRTRLLRGTRCDESEAPLRSGRGGSWGTALFTIRSATVSGFGPFPGNLVQGLRCVRAGTP